MTSLLEGACRITAPTDDRATFAITRLNPDSDRNQLCSCVEKDKVKKRRKRERESNLGWSKKVEYRREGQNGVRRELKKKHVARLPGQSVMREKGIRCQVFWIQAEQADLERRFFPGRTDPSYPII